MRRTPYLLVIAGLLAALVVSATDFASGRHNPRAHANSSAAFAPGYVALKKFKCGWKDNPHDYLCEGKLSFALKDALEPNGNPPEPVPNGNGWEKLSRVGEFSCERDDSGETAAPNYACTYKHRDSPDGPKHTHTIKVNDFVSVSHTDGKPEREDNWYPLHPVPTP